MSRSTQQIVVHGFCLLAVFGAGFLCGTFWSRQSPSTLVPALPPHKIVSNTPQTVIDEEQIIKALQDPEFKRVHDFLNRQYPAEMKIPAREHEPATKKEETPQERPPVQFTIPSIE